MNKINCNVIGDLLPLYVDGAVSEDTKKLVEEHLAECADCKKAAEDMEKELVLPVHEEKREDAHRSDFSCGNGSSHFGKLYGTDFSTMDDSL